MRRAAAGTRDGLAAIIVRHGDLLAQHNSLSKAARTVASESELAALDRQLTRLERRIITFRCVTAKELKLKLNYLQSLTAGDSYLRSIICRAVLD